MYYKKKTVLANKNKKCYSFKNVFCFQFDLQCLLLIGLQHVHMYLLVKLASSFQLLDVILVTYIF